MTDSATSTRERRMAQTALLMRVTARTLTIDRGLAGFTIEELCSEVGVSRRTFFNYYASKENAVIGIPARTLEDAELVDAFLTAGGDLLDDLVELTASRWELLGLSVEEGPEIGRAVEREPRLLRHLLELIDEGERRDIALVEQRESLPEGDVRASIAVRLIGTLMRVGSGPAFEGTDALRRVLHERLAATRTLFTPHTTGLTTT